MLSHPNSAAQTAKSSKAQFTGGMSRFSPAETLAKMLILWRPLPFVRSLERVAKMKRGFRNGGNGAKVKGKNALEQRGAENRLVFATLSGYGFDKAKTATRFCCTFRQLKGCQKPP